MANDVFVKFDGDKVKGDSTVEGREDWHDVESMSVSFGNPGSMTQGSGGSRGAATAHDMVLTLRTDKSYPGLFDCLVTHFHFPKVTVEAIKGTGEETYVWKRHTLERVVLSHLSLSGGNGHYMCNVGLNYAKMMIEVVPQENAGTGGGGIEAEYDFAREA